jgi:hypothetical protein
MKKDITLGPSTFDRSVSKAAETFVKNRFVENNPVLNDSGASFITRPALNKFMEVGDGHIRKVYSAPGVFNDDLFVVSGTFLHRVDKNSGISRSLGELSTTGNGSISMAATAPIGDGATAVPAHLFIAEGGTLWVYTENGAAIGQLEVSTTVANGDVVKIDTIYYQFTNASVDAGTPLGTLANPWLVPVTGVNSTDMDSLFHAVNATGVAGTDYSTALVEHPTVFAFAAGAIDLYVSFKTNGAAGNVTSITETGAGLAWTTATLTGGGEEQLRQVELPDDNGAISVAHINSYVIVVPVQSEDLGTNGRFYWIQPGEVTIDPLDFATAERSPDKLHQVIVFGEMFWLLGEKTTEPWITTGVLAAPMQKFQGLLFDRGSWEGTAVQVKDSLIVVDEDGGVFQIGGGQKRISRPDIEEKIRKAIQDE